MALARGAVIRPVEFNIPVLQIPFEQVYAQMQQMQMEKDLFDKMKGLIPKAVDADQPLVQEGISLVKKLSEQVAQKFAAGKVTDAMEGLQTAKGIVTEMWQPGGVFHSVQSFYDEYQKSKQAVLEHTKDFTNPAYRETYNEMVDMAAGRGSQYDPYNRKYVSMRPPSMMGEYDYYKELDSFLKDWKHEGRTGIERRNGGYYWIGTNEFVPASEIRTAVSSFLKRPQTQYAVGIDAKYQARRDPNGLGKAEFASYVINGEKELKANLEDMGKKLESGNVQQIKEIQKILGVSQDGIVGPKTKQAYENYVVEEMEDFQKQKELFEKQGIYELDNEQFYRYKIGTDLANTMIQKHSFDRYTGRMVFDQVYLTNLRNRGLKSAMSGFNIMRDFDVPLITPAGTQPSAFTDVFKTNQDAHEAYKQGYTELFKENPEAAKLIKGINQKHGVATRIISEAVQKSMDPNTGQVDPVKFGNYMRSRGIQEKVPVKGAEAISFRQMAEKLSDPTFRKSFGEVAQAMNSLYEPYEVASSVANTVASNVKLTDDQWVKIGREVSRDALVYMPTNAGSMSAEQRRKAEADNVRAAFAKGDAKVTNAFNNYVSKLSQAEKDKIMGNSVTYQLAGSFTDDMNKAVTTSLTGGKILSFLRLDELSEDDKAKLGVPKGKWSGSREVSKAVFSFVPIEGKLKPILSVTTENTSGETKNPQTVMIPGDALNADWVRNYWAQLANTGIDSNTGLVKSEESLFTAANGLFDLEQSSGTNLNPSTIRNQVKTNYQGYLGSTEVHMPDSGIFNLHTFVQRGSDGKMYLLATPNDSAAEMGQKTPSSLFNNKAVKALPIGKNASYDEINRAILDVKATYYFPRAVRLGSEIKKTATGDMTNPIMNMMMMRAGLIGADQLDENLDIDYNNDQDE